MPAQYSPRVSKDEMHSRIDDLVAIHVGPVGPETYEAVAKKWATSKGSPLAATYVQECSRLVKSRLDQGVDLHDFVADHIWCEIIWGLRSGTRMEEGE